MVPCSYKLAFTKPIQYSIVLSPINQNEATHRAPQLSWDPTSCRGLRWFSTGSPKLGFHAILLPPPIAAVAALTLAVPALVTPVAALAIPAAMALATSANPGETALESNPFPKTIKHPLGMMVWYGL